MALSRFYSAALAGVEAAVVEVEVDLVPGLPRVRIAGLAEKSVQEAADRVESAVRNTGREWPDTRVIVNLAPAELPKEGGFYDLAIALALLTTTGQLTVAPGRGGGRLVMGELALDGAVRPVRGALPAVITARQLGFAAVIVPRVNVAEAKAAAGGLDVVGVDHLSDAIAYFAGEDPGLRMASAADAQPVFAGATGAAASDGPGGGDGFGFTPDFADVRGQAHVKRAMEVAAAGGHNIFLMGAPGGGKTMCAHRLPSILPPLNFAESLETTKIWSVAGVLPPGRGLLTTRPFRQPHHNASVPAMVGGGTVPRPGEISLAHNGVLFLDEAPEFARPILEALRQPLENGEVSIGRARGSRTFPARIMLVLAANLCPCGRRGDARKTCRCSPLEVDRYFGRLSGPLLDRIDLHVEAPPVDFQELRGPRSGEPSAAIRERVLAARARQGARYGDRVAPVNAAMTPADIERHIRLDRGGEDLLRLAMTEFGLSARAHARILKVARTVADLAGAGDVAAAHLAEAVQYRTLERRP